MPVRRVVLGTTLALAILAAGATAAYATWQATRPLAGGIVTTGDFTVQATWANGTPSFGPLKPGDPATAPAELRVTGTGTGSALRWTFLISATLPTGMAMTAVECGTTTSVTSLYPAALAPGATIRACLSFRLLTGAPQDLHSTTVRPTITVNGVQVRP